MKEYTVCRDGEAREVFCSIEDATEYIAFYRNHDKTAKPEKWTVVEDEVTDGIGYKVREYGEKDLVLPY